ncbi:hypothetical protein ThvES_00002010 [Thiovulum sp. ES]|nr:hypothetical protein ThvES_00002010 [Thiovulum sp. ES]
MFKNDPVKELLLLAIYKKERDSSLNEVFAELVDVGAMKQDELQKGLETLENENLFLNNQLTFVGISEAKQIEDNFKIQK